MLRLRSPSAAIALLLAVGCFVAPLASGQTDPLKYLWGGELRQVHQRNSPEGRRLWAVGDGGMLRTKVANGPWTFLQTPTTATQTLLDVWFLPDGSGRGWACGVGGGLLQLDDWGQTIVPLPVVTESNGSGLPSTLWRVRFVDALRGYVCGLWTFKYTDDGGQIWHDVDMPASDPEGSTEFYGLEITGGPAGWVGVCIGQAWFGHSRGTAFRVDTSLISEPWTLVFDGHAQGETAIQDPWDVDFEPTPADYHTARGYMVGGGTSTPVRPADPGAIFSTSNGGQTWELEHGGNLSAGNSTMYGVMALPNGGAVACGYGGEIWWRTPLPGQDPGYVWENRSDPGFTGPLAGACRLSNGGNMSLVCGSFGFLRASVDSGASWIDQNPTSAASLLDHARLRDISFGSATIGLAVGQNHAIRRTIDGGLNWTSVGSGGAGTGYPSNLRGVAFAADINDAVTVGRHTTGQLGSFAYSSYDKGAGWTPSVLSSGSPHDFDLSDVCFASSTDAWAVGVEKSPSERPVLLLSADKGARWDEVPTGLDPTFSPSAIAFLNASEGVLIGNDDTSVPSAYSVSWDAMAATLTLLPLDTGSLAPGSLFNALAVRGSALSNAEVLIAGADGANAALLLRSSAGSAFNAEGLPRAYPFPLRSVAIAPGTGPAMALVGMSQRQTQADSPYLGVLLRGDLTGANWQWQEHKSQSNKNVMAISLLDPDQGWLLCRPPYVELGDGLASPEFGAVNDTLLVSWDPN